jgi:hypothetical protein
VSVPQLDERSYFLQNITGVVDGKEGYNVGLCTRKKLDLYCHNTFYGPIPGNENFYYLSLLNPSLPNLPNYAQSDDLPVFYAIGVVENDGLAWSHDYNTTASPCESDQNKLMVNLGSEIGAFAPTSDGVEISYVNGSSCADNSNYSTKINLICDKTENYGWPVFMSDDNCQVTFNWKTRYACYNCTDTELVRIEGSCKDGTRRVTYHEGEACISDKKGSIEESCSVVSELIQLW